MSNYQRPHDPAMCQYHSLCGPLYVKRATYRKVGERNGPTVVPLELEAGLAEQASPALCYSISQGYAQGTSRDYLDSMEGAKRAVPSRSTVERIGKALGTTANKAAAVILRYLRRGEKVPEEAVAISLGLDSTFRALGLPVGSGVTEGACKSLVGSRVKRSGQRWHPPGVSAVLTLRSILQSDRFPQFWGHLHKRYTARVEPVQEAAA